MRLKWITGLNYACATTQQLVEKRRESPRQLLNDLKGSWYD